MRLRIQQVISTQTPHGVLHKVYAKCQQTSEVYRCVLDVDIKTKLEVGQLWQSVGDWNGYKILGYLLEPDVYNSVRLYHKHKVAWNLINKGDIFQWNEQVIAVKLDNYLAYIPAMGATVKVGSTVLDVFGDEETLKSFTVYTPELVEEGEF